MIKIEDFIQLKAFARQDGAILALLWIASFAMLIYMPESGLGNLLLLATPVVVGWRLCSFRNYALEGRISFRRGYGFSIYMFIYASMLFAIAQYLYFRFLDHGTFSSMITATAQALSAAYQQAGMTTAELTETVSMMSTMTPIQWAFVFMIQNVMIGTVVSVFIAAVCARRGQIRQM